MFSRSLKFLFTSALGIIAFSLSAHAAVYTFVGTVSVTNAWSSSTVFSPNGVPGAGDTLNMNYTATSGSNANLSVDGTTRTILNIDATAGASTKSIIGTSGSTTGATLNVTGTLSKASAATLVFRNSGANFLTTNINDIELSLGNLQWGSSLSNVYQNFSATTVNISGGALIFQLSSGTNTSIVNLSLTGGQMSLNNSGTGTNTVIVNNLTGTGGTVRATNSIAGGTGILSLVTTGTSSYGGTLIDSSGTLAVSKSGAGTQTLSGTANYTGGTTISDGTLRVGNNLALGSTSGALTVSGGILDLQTFTSTVGALTISSGTITSSTGSLNAGSIAAQNGTVNAILSGSNGLTKSTSGTVTLTRANTYTGATTVSAGTLLVNGTGSSAVTVNGGVLGGSGTISASVTINSGGILSPGNSPGILNTGNLSIAGSLAEQLGKSGGTPIAGTDYDQTNVTGTVTLTGGDLTLSLLTGVSQGDIFYIINNDSSDVVTGVFATLNGAATDLSQDAIFTFSGQQFQISYVAATGSGMTGGNDVALMAVPEPGAVALLGLGLTTLLWRARARRTLANG